MSLFTMSKLRKLASSVGRLHDRVVGRMPARSVTERVFRHLAIDPLEQRQLLSVSAGNVNDILVNETLGYQGTVSGQSIAVDNDGDFVVTWTRNDPVYDKFGNPVVDYETGDYMSDSNIYARYFTDEVQRITLPAGVLTNNNDKYYATFSLDVNGNEVQRLTVTSGTVPSTYTGTRSISGSFSLWYDGDRDKSVDAGETVSVSFDEDDPLGNAVNMRDALRGLGFTALEGIEVAAISPQNYDIRFGNASNGEDQPLIQSPLTSQNLSGFYPSVTVEETRHPVVIGNIPVSPDDPWSTAYAIEQYLKQTSTTYQMGPTGSDGVGGYDYKTTIYYDAAYAVSTLRTALPNVSVTPVSVPGVADGLTFDITFVGNSGKIDQPEVKVVDVKTEKPSDILPGVPLANGSVTTIKQSSGEFRVNAEEPDDPRTPELADKFDQWEPAVAIDADGDFVITWTSEVADMAGSGGSQTDIFARRFSPTEYNASDPIPSVKALGNEFLVNTFTTGAQTTPSVGMDADGNFVITWSSIGEDVSHFNGVTAQRYNRDGDQLGGQFLVNAINTEEDIISSVAVSDDGHFIVTWTQSWPSLLNSASQAKVYGPDGQVLVDTFSPSEPNNADHDMTAAWDTNNNFVVTWRESTRGHRDHDHWTTSDEATQSTGVRAKWYQLYDGAGNISMTVLRDEFRANSPSAAGTAEATTLWPWAQQGGQAGLDADGDLVITYDGYGPDVMVSTSGMDVDSYIDYQLAKAAKAGKTKAQIALIRSDLEKYYDLFRGEANGVMYSAWDATASGSSAVAGDVVINSQRDGYNTRYTIEIDRAVDTGGYVINLTMGPAATVLTIPISATNALDLKYLRDALEAALGAGNVMVRVVPNDERITRDKTDWELSSFYGNPSTGFTSILYEVTFIGDNHDYAISMDVPLDGKLNSLKHGELGLPAIGAYVVSGDEGVTQADASMGIQPDGNFTTAWTQYEEDAWGSYVNSNVYVREMVQDTDTAGPTVTDFLLPNNGGRLNNGGQITTSINAIVVTFDEELTMKGVHSVLDTSNWALMKDGVEVLNGISSVEFGMNAGKVFGVTTTGSNKWEAVLFLDGNGAEIGSPSLESGTYQIVAKNSLRDEAGNALARTGYLLNGAPASRTFSITLPTGSETLVNHADDKDQENIDPTSTTAQAFPNSPQSVAADADGDYVSVWVNQGTNPGVYAKLYDVTWSGSADTDRTSVVSEVVVKNPVTGLPWLNNEICVTLDPTAMYASVARDGDGDFVVTWSAKDSTGDWNVWFQRYDALGNAVGTATIVNAERASTQRFSTVAMDNDGDFVITWQSLNQDGSGYGVYAQRYTRAGAPLDGKNEIQLITIEGDPTSAQFTLEFNGVKTGTISYNGSMTQLATDVGAALKLQLGLDVEVSVLSDIEIAIEFVGKDGLKNQSPLVIEATTVGGLGADLTMSTQTDGELAEFRVNDTVVGDQVFPSVAMDVHGDVMFTWTSRGQDGDASYETNVYAKRFVWVEDAQDNFVRQEDGEEFLVNTTVAGNQKWSSVAMDDDGDFVITWTSYNQDGVGNGYGAGVNGLNGIYAQRYNAQREKVGNGYTTVLTLKDNPTTANISVTVGTVALGTFEYKGDLATTANAIRTAAANLNVPIAVSVVDNTTLTIRSLNTPPSVVTITATTPEGGSAVVNTLPEEFKVNTYSAGDQQHSSVDMDADGDFMIVWESFQERPVVGTGSDTANSFGIYAQRYASSSDKIGSELHVNTTETGSQRFPTVALSDTGDAVIVWSGEGQGDLQGILSQRFATVLDDAGPIVTDVNGFILTPATDDPDDAGSLDPVADGDKVDGKITYFVVAFSEDLNTLYGSSGAASVLNKDYWVLSKNGSELSKGVYSVTFGLNQAYTSHLTDAPSGKYEAVVKFDADATVSGQQPLDNGSYTLTLSERVEDKFGNALDGDYDGVPAGDFQFDFIVYIGQGGDDPIGGDPSDPSDPGSGGTTSNGHTDAESPGAVAVDADGDYVLAWTASTVTTNHPEGIDRVYVRRFDVGGVAKAASVGVTADNSAFANDTQSNATVAIDADGDFIVTWTNTRVVNGAEQVDIYARRFKSDGTAAGGAFRVNTFTDNAQRWSSVAMDTDGDFVITWSSLNQESTGSGYGIFARRYDSAGAAYGAEFQVNTTTAGDQQFPSIAMDAKGAFVIAWQSYRGAANGYDIVAREFNADGSPVVSPLGGEFIVNDTLTGDQQYPDVATSLSGETYVITWSSTQRTDDQNGYAVYTKTFNRLTAVEQNIHVDYDGPTMDVADGATVDVPLVVDSGFLIKDLNIRLNITHSDPSDLIVTLISPSGTEVRLFTGVPENGDESGSTDGGPNGVNFEDTVFDDEAEVAITDAAEGALPPFRATFQAEQLLSAFDGENAVGTWLLRIEDSDPSDDPDYYIDADGLRHHETDGGRLRDWSIDFVREPAASPETLVNTTVRGNQMYSSVAMDHQGNFVVTWSGYGNQLDQEDPFAYGVYAQRFNAAVSKRGGETRLNTVTEGMQWLSSVGCDGEGNFVAIWTGDTSTPGVTGAYQYVSANYQLQNDLDGPIVTGVLDASGNVLFDGGIVAPGATNLTVLFGENLSVVQDVADGIRTPALQSVLNPANWVLERNGVEIPGAVSKVTFGLNSTTGKYQAVLTLDGNGFGSGSAGLTAGDYVVTVRDLVEDLAGNRLDGDFDGVAGTASTASSDGYDFSFHVSDQGDTYGPETRVNENTEYVQIFSEPQGTGFARETSVSSVAVDDDGDYVVVWTSYGQDDPNDPNGAGVYMRIYNRDNTPRTGEIRVNNLTAGDQRNASVAMDADGDFIIVWESMSDDGTWDVYAQRFDAAGNRIANDRENRIDNDPNRGVAGKEAIEVLVNTITANEQFNPSVAADDFGNYVIVWGSAGQSFGYFNNVNAQLFDLKGRPVGEEFQVNATDAPGVNGPGWNISFKTNPDVAMDSDGHFVVVWDVISAQENGVVTNTEVHGVLFDSAGNRLSNEFTQTGGEPGGGETVDYARSARNPKVAMNTDGTTFVFVMEAYWDGGYGYVYVEHTLSVLPTAGDPLVDFPPKELNLGGDDRQSGVTTRTGLDWVNPAVAVDADGEFAMVLNGIGLSNDPLGEAASSLLDDNGVFLFYSSAIANTDSDKLITYELVNNTTDGVQQFPSIAMTPAGDIVVVWQGNGVGDQHGVFVRTYDEPTDTAGPLATELRESTTGNSLIADGDSIFGNPQSVLVVFDEQMNTSKVNGQPGLHSVENLNNWALVDGEGNELAGAIYDVDFRFDEVLKKWTAEVKFANASGAAGTLANGTYTLIARTEMCDLAGNVLAVTGYRPNGTGQNLGTQVDLDPATSPRGGFAFLFRVNNTVPGSPSSGDIDQQANTTDTLAQDDSAIARNASGDYVVVWVDYSSGNADIRGQRFDRQSREIGEEFVINAITTGAQLRPDVAIDDAGNFVVVWTSIDETVNNTVGIFAQRFDADGKAMGGQFRVNQVTEFGQDEPAIAMNANNGDFVITWNSFSQDGNREGVYARQFAATGQAKGNEVLVNTRTVGSQRSSDVAMDALGNFVVTWASEDQDSSGWGVFAQRFSAAGAKLGAEFRVNTYLNGDQNDPAIAADSQGNFVITWASAQDGSGWGVYAQRYSNTGAKLGAEFRVNKTTIHDQYQPAIDWASNKAFVITWTSFNQDYPEDADVRDYGIFARMFNADGTDYIDARVGTSPIGEFRVNAITLGNQVDSAVSMDADGHYVVTWTGPERATGATSTAIYSRYIDPPVEAAIATPVDVSLTGTTGNDVFEFVGGPTVNTWIVKVNGETKYVGTSVGTLRFDGLGGQDSVIFTGASADDAIELWTNHGTFTSEYYNVVVSNVESITAIAGGGADSVILHDSAGDDLLVIRPEAAELTATGVFLRAEAFESVTALATAGGTDTVQIYDSAGKDAFICSTTAATIEGAGYYAKAQGFDYVKAYSTAGGADTADIYDTAGNDSLIATPTYAKLTGDNYYAMATGFRYARAYSTAGKDTATMTDSAGNDTFTAGPTYAKLTDNTSFYNIANRFRYVTAYGKNGGEKDVASLNDSTGNDTFVAGYHYGEMYGTGYSIRADFFRDVTGYSNAGGVDVANLYDSTGDDTLEVNEVYGVLYGNGFRNSAYDFERVNARATGGGYDVAKLTDAAYSNQDYLKADADWVTLSNADPKYDFAYLASGFDKVTATSQNTGDKKKIAPTVDYLFALGMWENE